MMITIVRGRMRFCHLYDRGYQRQDILNLFRFIDWMMRLPDDLERGWMDGALTSHSLAEFAVHLPVSDKGATSEEPSS